MNSKKTNVSWMHLHPAFAKFFKCYPKVIRKVIMPSVKENMICLYTIRSI